MIVIKLFSRKFSCKPWPSLLLDCLFLHYVVCTKCFILLSIYKLNSTDFNHCYSPEKYNFHRNIFCSPYVSVIVLIPRVMIKYCVVLQMLNSDERGLAVVLFNLIFTTVLAATPGEQYPCAPTLCLFPWENLTFFWDRSCPLWVQEFGPALCRVFPRASCSTDILRFPDISQSPVALDKITYEIKWLKRDWCLVSALFVHFFISGIEIIAGCCWGFC